MIFCIILKKYKIYRIKKYFTQSKITKEKIDLIEKGTGLNLAQLRTITDVKSLRVDF